MQVVMDDKTALAIILAREMFMKNADAVIKESKVEMDRLNAEKSDHAVMLLSLGGLLVTDDKFMVVEGD